MDSGASDAGQVDSGGQHDAGPQRDAAGPDGLAIPIYRVGPRRRMGGSFGSSLEGTLRFPQGTFASFDGWQLASRSGAAEALFAEVEVDGELAEVTFSAELDITFDESRLSQRAIFARWHTARVWPSTLSTAAKCRRGGGLEEAGLDWWRAAHRIWCIESGAARFP